ncbi:hypothetical protein PA7_01770 [Pseudonocardia asaccharolytica DSM 44247 = NBRC 16224]|uniref:Uncharacterized protein n=1 Tax=Pseudonocardia asaccharolytica DSM 44247 = NBRC 16224 TaxID=1123024 RepID=A0A511CUU0_9PSEU|nr:hypothetical protein PA7_01770 [Pseudonocardia asaccharolytica DSM 44247 = NBRC 16224]
MGQSRGALMLRGDREGAGQAQVLARDEPHPKTVFEIAAAEAVGIVLVKGSTGRGRVGMRYGPVGRIGRDSRGSGL